MNRLLSLCLLLLVSVFLLDSCKSAKKSLKRGNYDESVQRAVDNLRSNPRSSSADILKEAYELALRQHLDDLQRNENGSDPFRWERKANIYTSLNSLHKAIMDCPACARLVTPRSFYKEESEAREAAAAARYDAGLAQLNQGGRDNARQAFEHFEITQDLMPGYRDVNKLLDEAYQEATFKVVVEQVLVTSRAYQLSNEYFQDRVDEFLQTNRRLNKFVRFYTPDEATAGKIRPDHVVRLQFDDFVVGQTLIESSTEEVISKDSVKTGEATINGKKVAVYDKVKAKLTRSRKTVKSGGVLDMQIKDYDTQKIVYQTKLPGEYIWVSEWGSFNGDERALTPEQKRMTNARELLPPAPQQLFVEFSKPIYSQLTNKLRSFYDRY